MFKIRLQISVSQLISLREALHKIKIKGHCIVVSNHTLYGNKATVGATVLIFFAFLLFCLCNKTLKN